MASNREEPASKKRVAARQISKDDDPESEGEDDAMRGTFRRASDEVLAERRIVKVRRTPIPSSTPNPFASIKLVPPSATTQVPSLHMNTTISVAAENDEKPALTENPVHEASEKSPQEKMATIESPASVPVKDETNHSGVPTTVSDDGGKSDEMRIAETERVKEDEVTEEKEDKDENVGEDKPKTSGSDSVDPSGASSDTFQQLSGSKNAFAGAFGSGFGSSAFSFSTSFNSSSQPSAGFACFGSSFSANPQQFGSGLAFGQSIFGLKPSSEGSSPSLPSLFGKSNGSGSLFGSAAPAASVPATVPTPPVVTLQEVPVETGEEKEKAVFTADAALFEFIDGGWKERGRGELKLNVNEEKEKRPRLVMRSKGNYRLLLNANLFPDMKVSKMDNRGISFMCANSAADRTGLTTYAIKLKDAVLAADFSAKVEAHKGTTNPSNPKTPDSSPIDVEKPVKVVETSEV